jgi:itaconate CoA-transferase
MSARRRPLEGITVLSVEQAVAAPFATRQLADLGARVIKIERAEGDFARGYDDQVRGISSYFVWLNRGKESVVLDLKSDDGSAAFRSLAATADVVVQNLAPGAMERLGLGADDLLAVNPTLVHASITGYGRGGSAQDKKAYDLLIQCEAGLLSVTGTPDEPAKVGISIADIAAGMYTYSGILAALFARARTGEGDVLEVSMLEALGEWMSQPYFYAEYGDAPVRTGARHASIAPYGPFDTADGTVFFGIQNNREWAAFCGTVLKDAGLINDPRFATNVDRVTSVGELQVVIGKRFSALDTASVLRLLDDAGIANAQLRSLRDYSAHPQLAERDRWRSFDSPVGPLRGSLPPIHARSYEPAMGAVPAVGQHTESVLNEIRTP